MHAPCMAIHPLASIRHPIRTISEQVRGLALIAPESSYFYFCSFAQWLRVFTHPNIRWIIQHTGGIGELNSITTTFRYQWIHPRPTLTPTRSYSHAQMPTHMRM